MNSTNSAANPVLCAVELAVELLRCRALYNASTAHTVSHAPTAELYSYTALYSALPLYSYTALYTLQHSTPSLCFIQARPEANGGDPT